MTKAFASSELECDVSGSIISEDRAEKRCASVSCAQFDNALDVIGTECKAGAAALVDSGSWISGWVSYWLVDISIGINTK